MRNMHKLYYGHLSLVLVNGDIPYNVPASVGTICGWRGDIKCAVFVAHSTYSGYLIRCNST